MGFRFFGADDPSVRGKGAFAAFKNFSHNGLALPERLASSR
jgi:hypothetical protein